MINDNLLNAGSSPLGFLNPALYATASTNPSIVNDVTYGNNTVSQLPDPFVCTTTNIQLRQPKNLELVLHVLLLDMVQPLDGMQFLDLDLQTTQLFWLLLDKLNKVLFSKMVAERTSYYLNLISTSQFH